MKNPKIFIRNGLWYCRKPPCDVTVIVGHTVQEAIDHIAEHHPLKPRPKRKRKEKETASPLMQIIGKIKAK